MFTGEDIIYNKIENTKKDFDSKNKELLMKVESEIITAHASKLIGFLKGANFITENKIYFLSLLLKAEDMVINSFHLARQRAFIETFSILRIAIEAIATAIHISKDEKALNNYLNSNYKSTSSISYSKRYIPIIGEMWGAFSKAVVHINSKIYGPDIKIDKNKLYESITINYEAHLSNDNRLDNLVLIAIQLIAVMVQRAFEIIFFKEVIFKGIPCLKIPDTDLIMFGRKYSDKINDLYNKFLDVDSLIKKED